MLICKEETRSMVVLKHQIFHNAKIVTVLGLVAQKLKEAQRLFDVATDF
jgi:hypothetical protein